MMIVVVASRSSDMSTTREALAKLLPEDEVIVWPGSACSNADVVVGWDVPHDIYVDMRRLKLVHSIAAGTDNVILPNLPREIPVCRVADRSQAKGMLEYVNWGVTYFHRAFDLMAQNQHERRWLRPTQRAASDVSVGVMGLGSIGLTVAEGLSRSGYAVRGWSRNPKTVPGIDTFHGHDQLVSFLDGCSILVCLLPLTTQTTRILSRQVFDLLPQHAALIHCGRGEHLVEDDLRSALDSGRLRGAVIDVFEREPLEPEHWLWVHPRVVVTPHIASEANRLAVLDQVAENIRRVATGREPVNAINR